MKTLCSLLVTAMVVLMVGISGVYAQSKDDLQLRAAQAHIQTLNKQRLDYESKVIELSLQLQAKNQAITELKKQIEKLKSKPVEPEKTEPKAEEAKP